MSTKYRYARDSIGKLIDVHALDDSTRRSYAPYKCIGCGNELTPVLPTTDRVKHFKHKVDQNCSPETYLHHVGKNLFYDEYRRCLDEKLPFTYAFSTEAECTHYEDKLGVTCNCDQGVAHDLTKVFDQIELEKRSDSFQPDIRLFSSTTDHQMFIEIAVTHPCDQKKIESGVRIIEIKLQQETDLKCIEKHYLSEENEIITTYNMQKKPLKGDFCHGECDKFLYMVSVDRKFHKVKELTIRPWKYDEKYNLFHIISMWDDTASVMKRRLVDKIRELKYELNEDFKDCYLCQHHSFTSGSHYVRCEEHSIFFGSNQSSTCKKYLECSSLSSCKDTEIRNKSLI